MKKTRFIETQLVRALKEYDGGRKADDICRELQISKATLYNWKGKYGGMESSDVKRMKELEQENAQLKRMYANLAIDNEALRNLTCSQKKVGPCHQKAINRGDSFERKIPVSRVCKLLSLPRSQFYYRTTKDDAEVIDALQELAFKHPSYGFRKLFAYIRRSGKSWNIKRFTGFISFLN